MLHVLNLLVFWCIKLITCSNRNGLVYKPLILPTPYDIPDDLKAKDGSFPSQIITPGLFQGSYGSHGLEIILFRFKDEYEIHGHKVNIFKPLVFSVSLLIPPSFCSFSYFHVFLFLPSFLKSLPSFSSLPPPIPLPTKKSVLSRLCPYLYMTDVLFFLDIAGSFRTVLRQFSCFYIEENLKCSLNIST